MENLWKQFIFENGSYFIIVKVKGIDNLVFDYSKESFALEANFDAFESF